MLGRRRRRIAPEPPPPPPLPPPPDFDAAEARLERLGARHGWASVGRLPPGASAVVFAGRLFLASPGEPLREVIACELRDVPRDPVRACPCGIVNEAEWLERCGACPRKECSFRRSV